MSSQGTSGGGADLDSTDVRVLSYLAESGPDYTALIASNTGLHAPHVERRCERLVGAGLLEPVSGEVVFRLTSRGESAVDGALRGTLD